MQTRMLKDQNVQKRYIRSEWAAWEDINMELDNTQIGGIIFQQSTEIVNSRGKNTESLLVLFSWNKSQDNRQKEKREIG